MGGGGGEEGGDAGRKERATSRREAAARIGGRPLAATHNRGPGDGLAAPPAPAQRQWQARAPRPSRWAATAVAERPHWQGSPCAVRTAMTTSTVRSSPVRLLGAWPRQVLARGEHREDDAARETRGVSTLPGGGAAGQRPTLEPVGTVGRPRARRGRRQRSAARKLVTAATGRRRRDGTRERGRRALSETEQPRRRPRGIGCTAPRLKRRKKSAQADDDPSKETRHAGFTSLPSLEGKGAHVGIGATVRRWGASVATSSSFARCGGDRLLSRRKRWTADSGH